MKQRKPMRKNSLGAAILTTAVGMAVLSCAGPTTPNPPPGNNTTPTVTITRSPSDTVINVNQVLRITVDASDDLALANVNLVVSGVADATFDTTFTSVVVAFSTVVEVPLGSAGATVGDLFIVATVRDGTQNVVEARDSVLVTDLPPATISFVTPTADALVRIGDTVRTQVQVTNNLGIISLALDGVAHRGSRVLGTDTIITRLGEKVANLAQGQDTLIVRDLLPLDADDPTSETVFIRAIAVDSIGNEFRDSIAVNFVSGPDLTILNPPDSSLVSPGKQMTVIIRAQAPTGVSKVGYLVTGAYSNTDTLTVIAATNPQVRDTTITFTESVPSGANLGFITITPFGRDSLGNVGTGDPVTVEVVANAGTSDVTPPLVTHTVDARVETDDFITISAQDAGGISSIGFTITDITGGTTLASGTVALPGSATAVSQTFPLGLGALTIDTVAQLVVVTATATDANGLVGVLSGTGVAIPQGDPALLDTITVVAGQTLNLPSGGAIADALYNSNRNEIYFSNVERDRIEVFDVGSLSFNPAIPVGSRPWGIDLYPADTLGNTRDTLVVANSGGTNFSLVDLGAAREFRRHHIPIFVAQKVSISIEDGVVRVDIVDNHFSDRPQNLGTVCRVTTGSSACAPDSVFAVFSTSPSIDQGANPLRGTLRWENISSGQDLLAPANRDAHLFYEHAQGVAGLQLDTLQIQAGYGDTVITKLGGAVGVMANIASIGFLDTTFVRSSGNHARVMVGEGGSGNPIFGFARAMRYVIDRPFTKTGGVPVVIGGVNFSAQFQSDAGVSATINVSDFISNTAIPIRAVATNFNGLTNAVRADSVYVLDENLRLAGIVATSGDNPGVDMPFNHTFDATPAGALPAASFPANRVIYAARPDGNIDVFDTQHYGRVAQIPIKDPVTGPITIAQLPSGSQFLIAVTDNGVVVITLPTLVNPFPVRGF